ncbi:uncharacterized protein LOC144169679 [Haemaphysalis longicornis]
MAREVFRIVVVLAAFSLVVAQWQIRPIISAAGNSHRNFGASAGVRAEGVIHKFPNSGAKVIVGGEVHKSFGRVDGHGWNAKPQGQVGVRVEVPIGRK